MKIESLVIRADPLILWLSQCRWRKASVQLTTHCFLDKQCLHHTQDTMTCIAG